MPSASDMAERHGRILARLAELGLSLAEITHERAMAAETPAETADLGLAFHRISRSVRQTLALEARLEREGQRALAEQHVQAERRQEGLVRQRKAGVRLILEREIWGEYEGEELEDMIDALDQRVEREAMAEGFTTTPVEVQVARIRADLGLDAEAEVEAEEDARAPDPTAAPTSSRAYSLAVDDDYWRSSA